ncbi:lipoprotein [Leptospira stimsonii]|uniref:Lipoprotein n=1 Tax=Leptospira stimsonii TaxID=2202203 RepID=A0ABY2N375_9LEPT|nr:lipoprotein [Leptospira stimsonii]TGK26092.1 lipoprotein [Leptospira stimsonii]TGM14920.1 lipoprotein [Leptospira stimsonii]
MRIVIFCILSIFVLIDCSSGAKKPVENGKEETTTTVQEESNANTADEYIKAAEGFVNGDTFQVVISSLEGSQENAQELARKRAINLLIAEKGETFRSSDKIVIKELVETKGKIVKSSGAIQGKTYFLFQVNSPGLRSSLKR